MNLKASAAVATAKRMGVTDETLLKVVARLAVGDLKFLEHKRQADRAGTNFHVFNGTLDGKPFTLIVGGPAADEFS